MDDQKKRVESVKVPELSAVFRLSDYTPGIFNTIQSKKGMKNAIKKGLVHVNGKVGYSGDYIRGGEIIELYASTLSAVKPEINIPIDVLYEDDYLAVVLKPAGILVSGNKRWTLENALPVNLKPSNSEDALQRPEPIHRLDYPTSGALLVGKTHSSTLTLNKLFENRKIEKLYHAVTIGCMENSGKVQTSIDDKESLSEYRILERIVSVKYKYLNLVELRPFTGRRHQLRKHMAELGKPIFGDLEYGIEGLLLKGRGLYLHASCLAFIHPLSNIQIEIKVPLPQKFKDLFPEASENI